MLSPFLTLASFILGPACQGKDVPLDSASDDTGDTGDLPLYDNWTRDCYNEISGAVLPGPQLVIRGDNPGDLLGPGAICDFDGDHQPDVVVGAPGASYLNLNPGEGMVGVFLGRHLSCGDEKTFAEADVYFEALDGGLLGAEIDCGDLNGDGFDDIVIGAPKRIASTDGGGVFPIAGKSYEGNESDFSGNIYSVDSPQASLPFDTIEIDERGSAFGELGWDILVEHINDDEFKDGLYGSYLINTLYTIYGNNLYMNGIYNPVYLLGTSTSFGRESAVLGDVTGDGQNYLAVGSPWDNTIDVFPAFARTSGTRYEIIGSDYLFIQGAENFGFSIEGGGDYDCDGYMDTVVTASGDDQGGRTNNGSATILYGGSEYWSWAGDGPYYIQDLEGSGRVGTLYAANTNDELALVSRLSNGEGCHHLVVAVPGHEDSNENAGALFIVDGTDLPTQGTQSLANTNIVSEFYGTQNRDEADANGLELSGHNGIYLTTEDCELSAREEDPQDYPNHKRDCTGYGDQLADRGTGQFLLIIR